MFDFQKYFRVKKFGIEKASKMKSIYDQTIPFVYSQLDFKDNGSEYKLLNTKNERESIIEKCKFTEDFRESRRIREECQKAVDKGVIKDWLIPRYKYNEYWAEVWNTQNQIFRINEE